MPSALILSGAGRYADPWHQFAQTSPLLQALAQDSGWHTVITEDIDAALADGLDGVDLIIVNAGDPWGDTTQKCDPDLIQAGADNLAIAFDRGISLLGIHCAASSLRDYPQYRQALGGEWVPGRSWHPLFGDFHVRPLHDSIVEGLSDFTLSDERYTDLLIDPDVEPLATTSDENGEYVLAWAHTYGSARVIYDALGHDARSYESCGHKSFLRRAMCWLLPQPEFED